MKQKINFPLAITLIILCGVLLVAVILKCDFFFRVKTTLFKSSEMETELSFYSKSCADLGAESLTKTYEESQLDLEQDPYDEKTLGVKEIKWSDKTTLEIKALVSVNCAENVTGGDYEIQGNKIILKYIPSGCDPCALCKCVNELNYKIKGLTQKEYEFELKSEK